MSIGGLSSHAVTIASVAHLVSCGVEKEGSESSCEYTPRRSQEKPRSLAGEVNVLIRWGRGARDQI